MRCVMLISVIMQIKKMISDFKNRYTGFSASMTFNYGEITCGDPVCVQNMYDNLRIDYYEPPVNYTYTYINICKSKRLKV